MLRQLERLLGLRAGELERGILLFAYLFLVIGSFVVGKAVRDALFLDQFSALRLPYVDMAVAALVGVWVSIYLRVARRLGLRRLLAGSLLFFAANCLLFWWLSATTDWPWLTPIIYVWTGMFGVIAPAQVWTLANYVLTTREAKRLFGFIGSGATLGWIVGGFVTQYAATRFGANAALAGMAAALVLSAVLADLIWRRRPTRLTEAEEEERETVTAGLRSSLRLIAQAPYLRAIAAVILLSSFATAVAGWQFKAVASFAIDGRDELAAFFGAFNVFAGLLSFGLQWLLTGRLLRRLGLGFALFIVPTALALGSVAVLVFASLAAVVALRGSDQVLRYAIDKPTVELLYLPVPGHQTLAVKSFIDTVIWRLGDGLAGVTILLAAGAAGLTAVQVSWVSLVLIAGWMAAAWTARRQYVVNLSDSIHRHRVNAERAGAIGLDRAAADLLASQLEGPDAASILYALSLFRAAHAHRAHPAVRGLLGHESAEVRREAIRVLDQSGDLAVRGQIERLLYDQDLGVRTQALLYLAHHAHVDPLDRIEQLGHFAGFSIRAAMISFLAQPGPTENLDAARLLLERMLSDEDEQTRLEAARLLEQLPDHFEDQLREVLQNGAPEQVRHAIHAVGRLRKRRLVGRLVDRLGDESLGEDAAAALASFGDRIVGTLRDHLADGDLPIAVRRALPAVLGRIGTQAAQLVLVESLLDADTVLRFRVISALNKLREQHPGWPLDLRLVETVLGAEIMGHYRSYQVLGSLRKELADTTPVADAIQESMEKEVERIFRLMKLLRPEYDLHSAYVGLQSRNPVIHDNALEFIDTVLPPELRTLLVPLLDSEVTLERRVQLADRFLGTAVTSRQEAVAALLLSEDPWLRSCAAYAIGALGLADFAPDLDRLLQADDPLLRETARQARERLRAVS